MQNKKKNYIGPCHDLIYGFLGHNLLCFKNNFKDIKIVNPSKKTLTRNPDVLSKRHRNRTVKFLSSSWELSVKKKIKTFRS